MDFPKEALCERYNSTSFLRQPNISTNSFCPATWFNETQLIFCHKEDLIYQYGDYTIMHEVTASNDAYLTSILDQMLRKVLKHG